MPILDYATPPTKARGSRRVLYLLILDFFVFILSTGFAFIAGDGPPPWPSPIVALLLLAEIASPVTLFLFVFLLGWLASDLNRSRKTH